jgi:DNA-directed RNA polymerase subunit beta
MNKIFLNNVGDLAEAQRASFYKFLSTGITEELENFPNPFNSKIKVLGKKKVPCLVYLYTNKLKLKGPNYNVATCLKRDMSYTIQLYISSEYSYPLEIKKDNRTKHSLKDDENKNVRIKQDIFFGEVPLMTEEGTFVISGCERIIISQIIRSPGIYFRKEFNTSRKINYTANYF